jgi:threonine aldolase
MTIRQPAANAAVSAPVHVAAANDTCNVSAMPLYVDGSRTHPAPAYSQKEEMALRASNGDSSASLPL